MALAPNQPALMYARLKVMRLGASRLAYQQLGMTIIINNEIQTGNIRIEGVSITDDLNHSPNVCNFRCAGFVPIQGQQVRIYQGPWDPAHQLFGGNILTVTTVYEGRPSQVAYDVSCIDYTWLLNWRAVLERYVGQSATAIVQDLMLKYGQGMTANYAEPNMPTIDEITFTNEDLPAALTRTMARVGGYWFVDYERHVHAFITPTTKATPITQDAPHTMSSVQYTTDLSQIATRVTARGYGETALVDVDPGATTVPLTDTQLKYDSAGGVAEAREQRIAYTSFAGALPHGTVALGAASVATPPAPGAAQAPATPGNVQGSYQYCVTYAQGSAEAA